MIYEKEQLKKISFPIGGIGTGCIGLTGNGQLNDWEIFNRPNKNTRNGYSHFAICAKKNGKTYARVLHGDTTEDYLGAHDERLMVGFGFGPSCESMAGFPHFRNVRFEGDFPVAKLSFTDPDFPSEVKLIAFNPLIPHNDYDSSLPAGFFEWEIENTTDEEMDYSLSFSVQNPAKCSLNTSVFAAAGKGIFFAAADKSKDEIGYSDLTVLTDHDDTIVQPYWYRGGGWRKDAITTFWGEFSSFERLKEREYKETGECDHGTVATYFTIPAGEKRRVRFILTWNVPVQYNYWEPYLDKNGKNITWKNYYATQFENSLETATYALSVFDKLYEKTMQFVGAMKESTLPAAVIDAISANLSVLKSSTVMRLEDGSFWAWEGVEEQQGSCEGSCQHVWNYAYALPFLFPSLERSLRETNLKYALFDSGETTFRIPLPIGRKYQETFPCVDGQMGEVIKCYREWKISGDDGWLRSHAESIFRMLEFAWSAENKYKWDADCDGVLEGRQHHTLDMELFGPSSWLQGMYLLALDCGAKMATAIGDSKRAAMYCKLYENGKRWTNENLFNGKYYMQKIDLTNRSIVESFDALHYWNEEAGEIKYQVGEGCIIDQLLSDWHATIIGVNGVFDAEKKKKALESLYKYNYKPTMRDVTNMWRNFSINDESGTIICAYPEERKKPTIPIPYCEETMTGFEYALAGLMIAEDMTEEGYTLVKAVRDRYEGEKRNPWNEIECGSNYARSMASYALLPIYSGFAFDMTEKRIGFAPKQKGDWKYLWSVGNSWGTVRKEQENIIFAVYGETFSLSIFELPIAEKVELVTIDGKKVDFRQDGNKLFFDKLTITTELRIFISKDKNVG